jgi:hypothetical protein
MKTCVKAGILFTLFAGSAAVAAEVKSPLGIYPEKTLATISIELPDATSVALKKVESEEETVFYEGLDEQDIKKADQKAYDKFSLRSEDFSKAFAGVGSIALLRIVGQNATKPFPTLAATLQVKDLASARLVVNTLVQKLNDAGNKIESDGGVYSWPLDKDMALNAKLTDQYLIVTFEQGKAVISQLPVANAPALTTSEKYRSAMNKVEGENAAAGRLYINTGSIKEQALALMASDPAQSMATALVLEVTGLSKLDSFAWVMNPEGDGYRANAQLNITERKGLFKFFSAEALSVETAKAIPENVSFAAAGRVALSKSLEIIREVMAERVGEQADAMIAPVVAQASANLGFDVKSDFIENLGDEVILFSLLPERAGGWVGLEGLTLMLKVKDKQKAEKTVAGLMKLVGLLIAQANAGINRELEADTSVMNVKSFEYLGTEVKYLSMLGLAMPSVMVSGNYIVFSGGVYSPRAILRAVAGKDKSLTDNEEFKATMARAGMKGDEGGFIFYPKQRPGAASYLNTQMTIATVSIMAGIALPSLAGARERARRVKCMNNLKQIGIAMQIYSDDNESKYPPKLSDLYPRYAASPDLFICPTVGGEIQEVRKADGDIDVELMRKIIDEKTNYVYVSGLTTDAPADMVIIYEKTGNHDGAGGNVMCNGMDVSWTDSAQYAEMEAGQQTLRDEIKLKENVTVTVIEPRGGPPAPVETKPQAKVSDKDFLGTVLSFIDALNLGAVPPDDCYVKYDFGAGWLLKVKDDGIYFTGHSSGIPQVSGSGSGTIATLAVIAAIAIPNLREAQKAAEAARYEQTQNAEPEEAVIWDENQAEEIK